jgi:hypothetical protein
MQRHRMHNAAQLSEMPRFYLKADVSLCSGLQSPVGSAHKREFLHPSLASLGDGLPSRAGSQRDEAKRQASAVTRS